MITWGWQSFDALTSHQLYDLLQLRETVFTFGQQCTEEDMDNVDRCASHLLGYEDETLKAYLRVYSKNDKQCIGRVVVKTSEQGKGVGRELMMETINHLQNQFPDQDIMMGAQIHLEKFYCSLGFIAEGEPFMEAGIKHIGMRLVASTAK